HDALPIFLLGYRTSLVWVLTIWHWTWLWSSSSTEYRLRQRSSQGRWAAKRESGKSFFKPLTSLTYIYSRRFYPKRLTMYTHFTFTLMAHCTSGAIRGSVSCS